jgi:hypothetical protein
VEWRGVESGEGVHFRRPTRRSVKERGKLTRGEPKAASVRETHHASSAYRQRAQDIRSLRQDEELSTVEAVCSQSEEFAERVTYQTVGEGI